MADAMKLGDRHTAIMDAIREEIVRQFPDAFTEDSDAEIVVPRSSPERTVYVKLDVSSLAEAVLPLAASPPAPAREGVLSLSRDQIAQIIDPEAFVPMEDVIGMRKAYVKADAILAGVAR